MLYFQRLTTMLIAGFRRFNQSTFALRHTARMRSLSMTLSPLQRAREAEIDSCEMQTNKKLVKVMWKDGSSDRYPFLHLRDHCQCATCWHQSSRQRLFDTFNSVELDVQPKNVHIDPDGKTMEITWPDSHTSVFEADFLFKKRLPKETAEVEKGPQLTSRPVRLWDKSFEASVPRIPFNDIMHEDEALYAWLDSLSTVGLAYVIDAPKEPGQLEKLGQRVSYIRTTLYGKTFLISVRPVAYNAAYTSRELFSHSDLIYYHYNPGIQLLHCIEQTKSVGGASTLVDGFNAARLLKEQDPAAFHILASTPIQYETSGEDAFGGYDLSCSRPAIALDAFGRISAIAVNEGKRCGWLNVTVDNAERVYHAYHKFTRLLRDPSNVTEHKMMPGEIITMDNQRVLHGRRGYQVSDGDIRLVEGAYLEWDEVNSKRRLLAKKLGEPKLHNPCSA